MMHPSQNHARGPRVPYGKQAQHGQQAQYMKKESVPVDWATVTTWLKKNPHRQAPPPNAAASLAVAAPSAAAATVVMAEDTSVWRQLSVAPSTPLSCVLYALNHNSYSEKSESGRKEALRVVCTELQSRIDDELKGRAWPKAKTNEGIVEVAEKEVSPWSVVGLCALAELFKIQLVVLNETEKKIHFIPEDVCAWDSDRPVHYVAHNYRSIYRPPTELSEQGALRARNILAWLAKQEGEGWTFAAKEVKGTIEELNTLAAGARLILPAGKLKKDALVAHISRGLVLAHFAAWAALPE
jgi:hypothetical protein